MHLYMCRERRVYSRRGEGVWLNGGWRRRELGPAVAGNGNPRGVFCYTTWQITCASSLPTSRKDVVVQTSICRRRRMSCDEVVLFLRDILVA